MESHEDIVHRDSTSHRNRIRAADAFIDHFDILPRRRDQDLLWEVGEAFARLPYENLTKLIKKHNTRAGAPRRRLPWEVVTDHVERGTGGTCFSLTETFLAVLERLGYQSRPVLCDMQAGPDSHCAVWIDLPAGPHLMDPGYLLHQPVPLSPDRSHTRHTGVTEITVVGAPDGASYEVTTGGKRRYRMKAATVTPERFLALWDASFEWTQMGNLHLSRGIGDGYAYLHGHHLRLQRPGGKENLNLRGRLPDELSTRFGLSPHVVTEALRVLAQERMARVEGEGSRALGALGSAKDRRSPDPWIAETEDPPCRT